MKEPQRAGKRKPVSKSEQTLGKRLRQLRAERSISVRTLATRTGFSASFV